MYSFAPESKEALWDRYSTAAPKRQWRLVGQSKNSQESIKMLVERYSINPKTMMKWKHRKNVEDMPMGPKEPYSTVLSKAEEAMIVTFRTTYPACAQ